MIDQINQLLNGRIDRSFGRFVDSYFTVWLVGIKCIERLLSNRSKGGKKRMGIIDLIGKQARKRIIPASCWRFLFHSFQLVDVATFGLGTYRRPPSFGLRHGENCNEWFWSTFASFRTHFTTSFPREVPIVYCSRFTLPQTCVTFLTSIPWRRWPCLCRLLVRVPIEEKCTTDSKR